MPHLEDALGSFQLTHVDCTARQWSTVQQLPQRVGVLHHCLDDNPGLRFGAQSGSSVSDGLVRRAPGLASALCRAVLARVRRLARNCSPSRGSFCGELAVRVG